MDAAIVILLVIIAGVLLFGSKGFRSILGFALVGVVAFLIIAAVIFIPSVESENEQENSGPPKQHQLMSNWRSLTGGMSEVEVRRRLDQLLTTTALKPNKYRRKRRPSVNAPFDSSRSMSTLLE